MGKFRRGGYVFMRWKSDHTPRHVHVYREGKFVVKWDLDPRKPMQGKASVKLIALIQKLEEEGYL